MSVVEWLFRLAAEQPAQLHDAVVGSGIATPFLASAVIERAFDALNDRELQVAEAAFTVANLLFMELADWPSAIEAGIFRAHLLKYRAGTVEEYVNARELAHVHMHLARRLKLAEMMFFGSVVAADCAYFAAELAEGAEQRQWLLEAATDCLAAAELLEVTDTVASASFLGLASGVFASLVPALVQKIGEPEGWTSKQQRLVDAFLRRIVLAFESATPPSNANAARILARLSYAVGSPDRGREQLLARASESAQEGDLSAFVAIAEELYGGERASYRPSKRMRELRERLWKEIDLFRSGTRSRAGRFVTSQAFDRLVGMMATDEHAVIAGRDSAYAFHAVEINKARTLLDEIDGHHRKIGDPKAVELAEASEARAFFMGGGGTDAFTAEAVLASRLPLGGLDGLPDNLSRQLAELEHCYEQHDGGFTGTAPVASLEEVIDALEEGEALVEYHLPYDPYDPAESLLITFVSKAGALALHVPFIRELGQESPRRITGRIRADSNQPVDASALGELAVGARIAIQSGHDVEARKALRELHRVLVNPLAEVGADLRRYRTVFFVPHGFLHTIPFAALQGPDGRFLIEDIATAQAPSASVWKFLRDRERRTTDQAAGFLGFANPQLGPDHEPLPGTVEELAEVVSCLSPHIQAHACVGAEATGSALKRDLAGQSIVHFATHGEFPDEDVMNTHRIFLTPDGPDDGEVTARDLRGMDFDGTGLVVLGICDGGIYRFGPGDEPLGLVPGLLAAGARNVVGPLWAVHDGHARDLIIEFYACLLTLGPVEALRRAALSRLRAGVEIRDWAGFVLTGAARAPELDAHRPM